MKRKIIRILLLLSLFMLNNCLIFAADNSNRNENSGQSEIVYVANPKPSVEEIEKGDGNYIAGTNTGDTSITRCLEIMVITSAFLLMLIIFIREGEQTYEKN